MNVSASNGFGVADVGSNSDAARLLGTFLGAMIAVLLPEWLRFTQGYYLMLYAVAVILLLIWSPTGILGILDRYLGERRTRIASALRAAAKSKLESAP